MVRASGGGEGWGGEGAHGLNSIGATPACSIARHAVRLAASSCHLSWSRWGSKLNNQQIGDRADRHPSILDHFYAITGCVMVIFPGPARHYTLPLCRVAMREADARMLDYQGPAQSAKIASDRQIFGRAACGARAGPISALSAPPAAFPPPYRTLSTPTPDQLV